MDSEMGPVIKEEVVKSYEDESTKDLKYDETSVLGEGSSGFIFRGTLNGSPVAVKRVQLVQIKTTKTEGKALLGLDHPNIVKLLHVEDDAFFRKYALEFCTASLDQLYLKEGHPKLYQGPMPADREVLFQLANGLHYIHSSGLIHGDIKPRNVLIFTDPSSSAVRMKLSDFGLNRSGPSGRNWMAPERLVVLLDADEENGDQLEAGSPPTIEGDIFSSGCLFSYFIMRGMHPFGNKATVISQNIVLSNPVNISKLPRDAFGSDLIRRMIEKDPAKRMPLVTVIERLSTPHVRFVKTKQSLSDDEDPSTGSRKRRMPTSPTSYSSPTYTPESPSYLNASRSAYGGTTFVSQERRFAFHPKEAVLAVALVGEGGSSVIFLAGQDNSIPLAKWAKEERTIETKASLKSLEWSADGTKLAAGSAAGRIIVWQRVKSELKTDLVIFQSKRHDGAVSEIHWNPFDPEILATRSHKMLAVFHAGSKMQYLVPNLDSTFPDEEDKGDSRKKCGFVWISTDRFAAMFDDQSVVFYKLGSPAPYKTLSHPLKTSATQPGSNVKARKGDFHISINRWSSSMELLASFSSLGDSLKIWSLDEEGLVHTFEKSEIRCFCWHPSAVKFEPEEDIDPEKLIIACGMASGEVMIWNMEDKEPVQILRGHGNRVADVAFSPSGGRFLASSDENGELIIWSTKIWESIHQSTFTGGSFSKDPLVWNPTGTKLLTRSRSAWDGSDYEVVECVEE